MPRCRSAAVSQGQLCGHLDARWLSIGVQACGHGEREQLAATWGIAPGLNQAGSGTKRNPCYDDREDQVTMMQHSALEVQ